MKDNQFYLGEITQIVRNDEEFNYAYAVKFTVKDVIDEALAFPFRNENDEPVVGDKILLYNLDTIFGSAFLYTKLKEDDFIGFRSNGKTISITDESIDIFCHTGRDGNDGEHTVGIHLMDDGTASFNNDYAHIDINDDGIVIRTDTGSGEEQEIIIDSSSNISIASKGSISIKSVEKLTLESDSTVTLKAKNIVADAGSSITVAGTSSVTGTGNGPFCAIKVCPMTGMPHVGNTIQVL